LAELLRPKTQSSTWYDFGVGMRVKKRLSAVAAMGLLAAGFAGGTVKPVQAQGFFELLFGQPRYERREWQRGYRNGPRIFVPSDPQIRVKSPSYYTYQPDVLTSVSLASLAEVKTASADPSAVQPETTPFAAALAHLSPELKIRTFREVAGAIRAHYSENPHFVWVTDGQVNDKARAALAALARAGRFGLSPRDYLVEVPEDGVDPGEEASRHERLIRFEMELSAALLTYVLDATRGRIDPNRISGYHDLPRKEVDLHAAMGILASIGNVGAYLDSRNPSNPQFKALVAELAALRAKGETRGVEIAPGTFLRPGASSPEIANVIAAIRLRGSLGLLAIHAPALAAYDGGADYAPELVAVVRDFQRENDLGPDGIIGRRTIAALTDRPIKDKIDKVLLAMERARWLPSYLGSRYVFINQPAFEAAYMQTGKEPLSTRIIVGKKSNQTAFFADRIETVEYNPYWGVPLSIIVNEMMPELYNDPSYLDRIGYEVTTESGRRVSSRSVDWYGVATKRVSVNVRQPPGQDNALGVVKILFPNKHSIYMHDTPTKNLFDEDSRAFSHGCVRLQKPREMAAAVLGKPIAYVDKRIAEGRNDSDPVTADVAVYVAYFTAWPAPDGTVRYYDDMYDRDMYLGSAIARTNVTRHPNG